VILTNLIGRKVIVHDIGEVPERFRGQPASIATVWLHPEKGCPQYTLLVGDPREPLRELWDTDADTFGANK